LGDSLEEHRGEPHTHHGKQKKVGAREGVLIPHVKEE